MKSRRRIRRSRSFGRLMATWAAPGTHFWITQRYSKKPFCDKVSESKICRNREMMEDLSSSLDSRFSWGPPKAKKTLPHDFPHFLFACVFFNWKKNRQKTQQLQVSPQSSWHSSYEPSWPATALESAPPRAASASPHRARPRRGSGRGSARRDPPERWPRSSTVTGTAPRQNKAMAWWPWVEAPVEIDW